MWIMFCDGMVASWFWYLFLVKPMQFIVLVLNTANSKMIVMTESKTITTEFSYKKTWFTKKWKQKKNNKNIIPMQRIKSKLCIFGGIKGHYFGWFHVSNSSSRVCYGFSFVAYQTENQPTCSQQNKKCFKNKSKVFQLKI